MLANFGPLVRLGPRTSNDLHPTVQNWCRLPSATRHDTSWSHNGKRNNTPQPPTLRESNRWLEKKWLEPKWLERLLPVCKSTSYTLGVRCQGPREGVVPKVGVPVRLKICACLRGVNFRPAGGARGAGCRFTSQEATRHRYQVKGRGGAAATSLHPEVPGIQFGSPGYGLDIRQPMGWTKVCGTKRSGIWAPKGNARARMLPENLDYLPVGWRTRGTCETAWVTPGRDCLCSFKYGHGVRPQTNNAIWDGVIGLWDRVAPFLSPWCGEKDVPTGVNLNQCAGSGSFIRWHRSGSFIRWHSGNEPVFGPQSWPKLIVSMSLGNSVEFKVHRHAPGKVPSSILLDLGHRRSSPIGVCKSHGAPAAGSSR